MGRLAVSGGLIGWRRMVRRNDDRSSVCSAWSTMRWAIASDAVAAGLGALRTCRLVGVEASVKSSTMAPSAPTAWARTPDGPKLSWSDRTSGTYRCSCLTKAALLTSRQTSWAPVRQ